MPRQLGFFFALALVGAVFGFGHNVGGGAIATVMRILFVVALLLMLMVALFSRRSAA
jgi:uncharacterized membrane protein YtjA (UPF0391 family)